MLGVPVEYATIIAMLALAQYMFFIAMVGKARMKYGIKAPSCTGDENFERVFRVQQNTIEQLVIFLPSLFGFSYYVSPLWGPVIGCVYILGRLVYYHAYVTDPASRGAGMLLTFIPNALLTLGAIAGATYQLL